MPEELDADPRHFDYHLPPESIAQEPLADRAASRMLVLNRNEQRWDDRTFRELPEYVHRGDCLVLNDSKVFPSRIYGHRRGAQHTARPIEVLLLRPIAPDAVSWHALVRPGKKLQPGERIQFEGGLEAEIVDSGEFGARTLRFASSAGVPSQDIYAALDAIGHVPLPPYIKRADRPTDRERYQTVYARQRGSVAAPTAGLHFTPEVLEQCRQGGAEIAYVTLHVGLGTFQPVRGPRLHAENFEVPVETAAKVRAASRVIAVGTTSVRTLESMLLGKTGETDLFIRPGFEFRGTDAMLTNFHLPQSSLLMLVCAFAGRDLVLSAYRHAVEAGYRFYSYGDCMLVL